MTALGYLCALVVGLVLGLLGGGGSILSVPILVYLFGLPASVATAYSLFLVGVSSFVGAMAYWRSRLLDAQVGAVFLLPSMLGVGISRRGVLPSLPPVLFESGSLVLTKDRLILLVFSGVMALASYSMLRPRGSPDPETASARSRPFRLAAYGLFAGLLMGFVGAGGGFLVVPVLVALGRVEMKRAVGTSLFIITVSSLFGFSTDLLAGLSIDWPLLVAFTGLAVVGVVTGARLSHRVPSVSLKKAFGLMVLAVGGMMVAKELFFPR